MSTNYSTGKGLAALLEDISSTADAIKNNNNIQVHQLDLSKISPGTQQPRQIFDTEKLDDLVSSIKIQGVLQPIIVREKENGRHDIIAGERRYRASLQAGLERIPAIIINCDDTKALEIGLIENLQRDDLNPMDEGEAYLRLIKEYGKTQEEIAKAVSKSRSYVANQVRLTTLPDTIKKLVREKKITASHARNLINHPEAEKIAERIMGEGLNVRELEQIRQQGKAIERLPKLPKEENEDIRIISEKLTHHLGMKVKITTSSTGGTVTLYFNSYDQLDDLIIKLDS